MANVGANLNASNFFITLSSQKIDSLYKKHTIFGKIVEDESFETLSKIN